ncbi:MAG TPA: hypothetical protein VNJ02_15310 [Vicinamibacterales bacterium]|nr:hypothetical protein [Vicinamibacterales bacterium]
MRAVAVLVLTLLALNGWLVPESNQRWREAAASHQGQSHVSRSVRELSLLELAATRAPSDAAANLHPLARGHELHARLGLIVSPIPIAALGLAVSRRRRYATAQALLWWAVGALVVLLGW